MTPAVVITARAKQVCKNCGKEITQSKTALRWWIHIDGFYNCDGRRGHAATYAEPVEETQ